jgi:hypothetical protein
MRRLFIIKAMARAASLVEIWVFMGGTPVSVVIEVFR